MPRTNLKEVPMRESSICLQDFLDMIASSIIKFNTDHFICGSTFRCVWLFQEGIPDMIVIDDERELGS